MNEETQYRSLLILLSAILILSFTFTDTGCSLLKKDKQTQAEKKQENSDKQTNAEYEKARKQHYAHQSKDVKKMMKGTQKQASKYNRPRKRKAFSGIKCS